MDDGSPIRLQVTIDEKAGSAVCDFTGTGHQVIGNCNAPTAITLSALIYCLRCMIGHDVPLNQGCVKPIRVILPKASILSPTDTAGELIWNILVTLDSNIFRKCSKMRKLYVRNFHRKSKNYVNIH